MDFNNIFTNSDIIGMMIKEQAKKTIRKAIKGQDKEMQVTMLKLQLEVTNEVLEEIEKGA